MRCQRTKDPEVPGNAVTTAGCRARVCSVVAGVSTPTWHDRTPIRSRAGDERQRKLTKIHRRGPPKLQPEIRNEADSNRDGAGSRRRNPMPTTRPLRFSQLVAIAILPLVVGSLAGCAMNPGGDPSPGQALVDVTVAGDGTGTVEQDANGSKVTLDLPPSMIPLPTLVRHPPNARSAAGGAEPGAV